MKPTTRPTPKAQLERRLAGVVAEVRVHEAKKRQRGGTRIEDKALYERVRRIAS